MDKTEPVDPKETLVNLVLKVCQEDRVEMVQLVSLDLQVPWWKVKRSWDLQDLQVLMGPQELQGPQVSREKWEPEEIQAEMEKMVNLDPRAIQVSLEKKVHWVLLEFQDPLEVKEILDLLEKLGYPDPRVRRELWVNQVWKVHLDFLVIQDRLEGWVTKEPLEEMARMDLMEIQDHLDLQELEANLARMGYQVHLDPWVKKVLQEVRDHLDFLAIKVHQENKEILDCQDLKEEEVGQDLRDLWVL